MEYNEVQIQAVNAYGKTFRTDLPQTERASRNKIEPVQVKEEATSSETPDPTQTAQNAVTGILAPVEDFMLSLGVDLKFHVHEESGEVQAEVRDSSGEKVIRKIPSDEVLKLSAKMKEFTNHYLDRAL